jgi:Tol biopolymer transport system component
VWSPDGTHLAFGVGVAKLVSHAIDSSTPDQVFVEASDRGLQVGRWLADGRLVYNSTDSKTGTKDIMLLAPGSHTGRLVASVGIASVWDVSPDGRWLAYDQNTQTQITGDVFVQAIPGPGPRTQISTDGGGDPAWSADGRTLYYLHRRESKDALFAVDIHASSSGFTAGKPRELFQRPDLQMSFSSRSYDVSADGQRFLMRDTAVRRASVTRLDLVLNWAATLSGGR